MDPETIAEAGKQAQYFRTPEFSKIMLECADMLQELLDVPEDTRMIFLTASGTAAMEASVMNLFTPADRVLVLSGGTFGRRFKQICQIHHIPTESIDLEWNEAFTPDMLANYISIVELCNAGYLPEKQRKANRCFMHPRSEGSISPYAPSG
jgi:aspartate aminotransferase-like enzyme